MLTPYAAGKTVVPGAVRALGVLDLDAGNLDAANARFEELLATGAQSYEALVFPRRDRRAAQGSERAMRFYSRVTGGEYALPAQQRVARLKADQSGIEAGLTHLDELARSQPQFGPDVVQSKAGLLSALGDEKRGHEGTGRWPDAVIRTSSTCAWTAYFCTSATDREDAAIKELRAMLAERPGDATLQNALGYTLADHDTRLDEAQSLIAAALAQTPDNAAVLDSMGWLLYRQGKPRRGREIPGEGADGSAATRNSTCTSAKRSGRPATRPPRARPGRTGSSGIQTTKSSASGSSARGPDADGGHRACAHARIAAFAHAWCLRVAGCASETAGRSNRRRPRGQHDPIPRFRNGWPRDASHSPRRVRVAAAVSSGSSAPNARNCPFVGRSVQVACRSSRTAKHSN